MSTFSPHGSFSPRALAAGSINAVKPKRPSASRNVSFTSRPSASRNVSFTSGPPPGESAPTETIVLPPEEPKQPLRKPKWQRVNRQEQNVDPKIGTGSHAPIRTIETPFLVLSDEFAETIGQDPRIELMITDDRAPYFHSGGVFVPRLSTLFLTSNLLQDNDSTPASSANRRTEITKIDFYSSRQFARDKVRWSENAGLVAGATDYSNGELNGLVVCSQGSLTQPSGLVYIDTKRPHKARMLLNNFHGKPFNSPCDIVSNPADGGLYFTDPAYGWERHFRDKPQLPSGHIYRFDPETGECRVVANGHSRPAGLALSPDNSTLFISELGDKYGGTNIFAYTIATSDSFRDGSLGFPLNVPNYGGNLLSNHKSTPSNSTVGSQNSSSGHGGPTSTTYSLNRTAPLTPCMSPVENNRSEGRSTVRPASPPDSILRSPLLNPAKWPFHKDSKPQIVNNVPTRRRTGPFLTNKRFFAYTPSPSPSGLISTDPRTGHLFLGTEEGVEVFSADSGELIGKILVEPDEGLPVEAKESNSDDKNKSRRRFQRGVSKVAFGLGGEFWLLGGERIWKGKMDWSATEGLAL